MDYEKENNEALERAKKVLLDCTPEEQKVVEYIFPSLIKNEDKIIIEEIIDFLRLPHPQFVGKRHQEEWIAWLEKQGGQKETLCDKCKKTQPSHSCQDITTLGRCALEKQGEQKPTEFGDNRSKELSLSLQIQAYLNTASDELYAKGKPLYSEERVKDIHKCMLMWQKLHNTYFYQKSTWSEEDEDILNTIINHFKVDIECTDEDDMVRWLKALKDRVQPQPKNEWDEEDERNFNDTILFIETGTYSLNKDNLINWLKSLRHQKTWKPSDEHYELEEFAKIVRGNLTGISKAVQKLFEAKYLQLTGNKMYGGFKD